jgi:hypothetical protein
MRRVSGPDSVSLWVVNSFVGGYLVALGRDIWNREWTQPLRSSVLLLYNVDERPLPLQGDWVGSSVVPSGWTWRCSFRKLYCAL